MRSTIQFMACACMLALLFVSCQQENLAGSEKAVSKEVLDKIWNLGFSNENVQKVEEGYLVEGDIILTEENLHDHSDHVTLRIAETEQYRTTNLVTGLPRVITVSVDPKLVEIPGYSSAADVAIGRFNSENLQITMQRVNGTGQIHLKKQGGNFLASAGFPSGGNPYPSVKINSTAIGQGTSNTFINYCATIMAHEMGHCIGFRHTDYMNRSFSCGGSGGNEGSGSVGAVHIPGTPTGPDDASWMLACIGNNMNRPFNNNDRTALSYLY